MLEGEAVNRSVEQVMAILVGTQTIIRLTDFSINWLSTLARNIDFLILSRYKKLQEISSFLFSFSYCNQY